MHHDTSFELIDFLTCLQVAITARMAKEHTNRTMVQRALDGELESNKEAVLQKIGCKRNKRSSHLLIEQLDLNMALIEVYQELAKMTRVAKDMASSNKQAHKQAKCVTDL